MALSLARLAFDSTSSGQQQVLGGDELVLHGGFALGLEHRLSPRLCGAPLTRRSAQFRFDDRSNRRVRADAANGADDPLSLASSRKRSTDHSAHGSVAVLRGHGLCALSQFVEGKACSLFSFLRERARVSFLVRQGCFHLALLGAAKDKDIARLTFVPKANRFFLFNGTKGSICKIR
jgi:hypothetical protein